MFNLAGYKKVFIVSLITLIVFYITALFSGISSAQNVLMPFFISSTLFLLFDNKKKAIENSVFYLLVLLPIINFTKGGFFFYNIITILLGFSVFHLFFKERNFFFKNSKILVAFYTFFTFCIIYYLFSYLNTGRYETNLRFFELFFTAILVARLWQNRFLFNLFIVSLSLNSIAFVSFMLNQAGSGARLMLNSSELLEQGIEIGGNNPISYGLPIAFCIVCIYSYLRFTNFITTKFISLLLGILFLALFLTTSRGSFLVLILILPIYFYTSGKIKELFKLVTLIAILFSFIIILSSLIPDFQFAYEFLVNRTQSGSGLNKISHGRTEQWQAMLKFAQTNFSDLIIGFGAGNQMQAHEVISMSLYGAIDASFQGTKIAFHALPLQLISEIGIVGLIIFYFLAFKIFAYDLLIFRKSKFSLPLLGFIGWIGAGLSVSSLDPFSGLFFGLAIIPIFNKI